MVGGGIANVALAGRDGMLTQAAGACSRKTLGVELASSVDIMPHGRIDLYLSITDGEERVPLI